MHFFKCINIYDIETKKPDMDVLKEIFFGRKINIEKFE